LLAQSGHFDHFYRMEKIPVYGVKEFVKEPGLKGFYANRLPAHLQEHQFINVHHKHSTFVTVMFTKGTGTDFHSYPVKRGNVFFLNPGQVHRWSLSADTTGYIFFHTKEFYEMLFPDFPVENFPFFAPGSNHPLLELWEESVERLAGLYENIISEFTEQFLFKEVKIGSLISQVYVELSRLYPWQPLTTETSNYFQKVKKLQKLIDENFRKQKQPSVYAEMMNMSTRHLSRICMEVLSISTSEMIHNRIVLEAKRMLIHQDTTVSLIANTLGFEEVSYFIRLFKKKTGMTPTEFRMKPDLS